MHFGTGQHHRQEEIEADKNKIEGDIATEGDFVERDAVDVASQQTGGRPFMPHARIEPGSEIAGEEE